MASKVALKNALATQKDIPTYRPQDTTHIAQAVIMDDQYDVALFAASVHGTIDGVTSDFVLGEPTPAQRQYITEMYKIALLFKNVLPDKKVGARLFNTIMSDAHMHILLARNKPTNSLVQWILGVPKEPKEDAPTPESQFTKIMNKIKRKDEKQEEEK